MIDGYDWKPVGMTLRSQNQGLPHPKARVHAVVLPPPWVPSIVAFHQGQQGHLQAHLHWAHPDGDAGDVIPVYCLRGTFTSNFQRNIPERPDWIAARSIVARLARQQGRHSIDLFETQANRQFPRYGSQEPNPEIEWCNPMHHDLGHHTSGANPPPDLLQEIADSQSHSPPMGMKLIIPMWEGLHWYGTLIHLCLEYFELPTEFSDFTTESPSYRMI